MIWDPTRIEPKSWPEVQAFYAALEDRNHDFAVLRALAAHVRAQPYANSLAGAISGTSLLVAPKAQPDWAREAVRVDLDFSGAVRFDRPGASNKASTLIHEDAKVTGYFERLLHELRWNSFRARR